MSRLECIIILHGPDCHAMDVASFPGSTQVHKRSMETRRDMGSKLPMMWYIKIADNEQSSAHCN